MRTVLGFFRPVLEFVLVAGFLIWLAAREQESTL